MNMNAYHRVLPCDSCQQFAPRLTSTLAVIVQASMEIQSCCLCVTPLADLRSATQGESSPRWLPIGCMTRRPHPYRIAGLIASSPRHIPRHHHLSFVFEHQAVVSSCSRGRLFRWSSLLFCPGPTGLSIAQPNSNTPPWLSSMNYLNRPPCPSLSILRLGPSRRLQRWALWLSLRLGQCWARPQSHLRFPWTTMRSLLADQFSL